MSKSNVSIATPVAGPVIGRATEDPKNKNHVVRANAARFFRKHCGILICVSLFLLAATGKVWAIIDPTDLIKNDSCTFVYMIKDWEKFTGMIIRVGADGFLEAEADINCAKKAKDTTSYSKTARKILSDAISSKDTIYINCVKKDVSCADKDSNNIFLNGAQIKEAMENSVGIDPDENGYGMTALHELVHIVYGEGDLYDGYNVYEGTSFPGFVEYRYINKVRVELDYHKRSCYHIRIGDFLYIAFDNETKKSLNKGQVPPKETGKYTKVYLPEPIESEEE